MYICIPGLRAAEAASRLARTASELAIGSELLFPRQGPDEFPPWCSRSFLGDDSISLDNTNALVLVYSFMSAKNSLLHPQELEIMKLVWERECSSVRDIYEALRARRKVAYTTVMTMMNILEKKGYLRRRYENRAYLYSPARPRQQVIRAMVRDFVDRVFNGSVEPLVVHLIKDKKLSERELREIARMIEDGK